MKRETDSEEARLQAFVDDRLAPAARAQVEARLAQEPAARARVEALRRQREALHAVYDGVLDEPIPPRLQRSALAPRPGPALPARAAAALWLLLGTGAGWLGATAYQDASRATPQRIAAGPALAREAAVAYAVYSPEVLHPVEVDATQEKHLLGWLSKRLGHPLRAPELTRYGYRLMGGRLLPAADGPAAQLMYENRAGERLTLYVTVQPGKTTDTAFRYAEERGLSVFYWIDRDLGYALTANLARPRLLEIAGGVYRQLEP
ncbi:anti-sigma factor family protein [Acidihalobacter prosperus]|uniref:Anti-sigma factor n=1 Tax=Acidihalobacter prosperus TaxID=160660 RepID=A0A1A6C093_9GAMM|nr:anti-sigma factor [Acidihalobacter prosperus]OBS07978.1 hypothetical protein Thpro_022228 [Acidihalobacter prosperus]